MTARKRHRQQQHHHTQNQQQQQLHNAARNGDVAEVARLLSLGDGTVDVNTRDRHSRTALHLAAWAGHADVVRLLCTSGGAAVNAAATDDTTALHFAAQKGHVATVKALLAAGAKVSSRTRRGQTALHLAAAAAATAAAPAAPVASSAVGAGENAEGETAAADAKPTAAEHSESEAAERAEETKEVDEERRKGLGGSEGRPHGKPDEGGDREGGGEPGHAAAAADPAVSSDPREVSVSAAAAAHAVVAAAEEGSDVTGHVSCNEAAQVSGAESLSEGEQRFADVIRVLVKKAGSAGSSSALDLLSAMTNKGETASDLAKSPRIKELLQQLTLQEQVQQSSKQDKKHGKEGQQQQQQQQQQQKQQEQHEWELQEQASLSRRTEEDLTEGEGLIKHSNGEPLSVTTKAEVALEEEEPNVRKQGYGDKVVQTDVVIGPTSSSASGADVDVEADAKGKDSEERSRSREGKKAKVSLSHLGVEDDFEEE